MIAGAVLAAALLALALRLVALRRRAPALPPPIDETPPTAILLPLRDEAENVVDCVGTLLAQSATAVFLIDDGSCDATPRRIAELSAASPRIEARLARPLPEHWSGKVNALATAFAEVETEWVLLTDADTRHAPDLLARAHGAAAAASAAAENGLDALSLAGRQEARGLGENLLTPPVYALLDLLLGDWAPHARGEAARPVANGQYFLIRAPALREIGGFESIVGQPLDDVALATALAKGGFRVGFRRAGVALRVRMYRGFTATAQGWRRNLALILGDRTALVAAAAAPGLAASATLTTLLITGEHTGALLAWLGCVAASALARRSSGNHPLFALLSPLDLLALSALLARATIDRQTGRIAAWRGRDLNAPRAARDTGRAGPGSPRSRP